MHLEGSELLSEKHQREASSRLENRPAGWRNLALLNLKKLMTSSKLTFSVYSEMFRSIREESNRKLNFNQFHRVTDASKNKNKPGVETREAPPLSCQSLGQMGLDLLAAGASPEQVNTERGGVRAEVLRFHSSPARRRHFLAEETHRRPSPAAPRAGSSWCIRRRWLSSWFLTTKQN